MNIEKIKPSGIFTNYIYKTIPLAFDESMSYYETLCGILSLLKTQEEVVNHNADLLAELEEYVNHYFDNLNVQTEINNKLDDMVEDGTLAEVINEEIFNGLDSRLTAVEEELEDLSISNLSEMVVFGDSWSDTNVTEAVWPQYVADNLNLNLHNYASSGAGFVAPNTNLISTQVTTATNDTTYDHTLVKYVIFQGGINDFRNNVTLDTIRAEIVSLCNASKLVYPNAKILFVNNFQYPYTSEQSAYWYRLQYQLSSYNINALNQDGFFKERFFLENHYHLTVNGQRLYGSNIVSALSGGQIKNEGVFIDFENSNGYMYMRRDDNLISYYILFNNLSTTSTTSYVTATQDFCWTAQLDAQILGVVGGSYKMAIFDFDVANSRFIVARQDATKTTYCFNGCLTLHID